MSQKQSFRSWPQRAPKVFPVTAFGSLALFLAGHVYAQDPVEIVHKSLERDWTDFSSQKDYVYEQRTSIHQYDKHGRPRHEGTETAEIFIISGRRFERLVARDDKPLSPEQERREKQRVDREIARVQKASSSDRARFQKEREQERAYLREIPDAFVFHLLGTENVSGVPAWVLDAEPRPGYRPSNAKAAIFTKVRARIWVEQATYHWVKAEAEVLDTLSFGLGLFRVSPGAHLAFEQTHVNGEIWLPSLVHVKGDARLALVKKIHGEVNIEYAEYRKFQAETQILEAQEIGGPGKDVDPK